MKKWMVATGAAVALAAAGQMVYGIYHWKKKSAMAVSIIGGADGPTSVFLAGKVPSGIYMAEAVCGGLILLGLAVLFLIWKKRSK